MLSPEEIARLPKKAQTEIKTLMRELAEERAHVAKLTEGLPKSDTYQRVRESWEGADRPTITTYLDPKKPVQFAIGAQVRDERFVVNAHITSDGVLQLMGDEMLVVTPQASNVIQVRMGREWLNR